MPDSLIRTLTVILLALVYLFFVRVVAAVWSEVREPKQRRPAAEPTEPRRRRSRTDGPPVLTVAEPSALAGLRFEIAGEATIGRAPGCLVRLDDPTVSQLHARLFLQERQLLVEDLGSTNGTRLGDVTVTGPRVVARGDRLAIGGVVLEVGS